MPPCPGDEGIAVGCAAFGWHQRHLLLPSTSDSSGPLEDRSQSSNSLAPPLTSYAPAPNGADRSARIANAGGGSEETLGHGVSAGMGMRVGGGGEKARVDDVRGLPGGVEFGGRGVASGELCTPLWGRAWSADDVEDEIAECGAWIDVRDAEGVEVGGVALMNWPAVVFSFYL